MPWRTQTKGILQVYLFFCFSPPGLAVKMNFNISKVAYLGQNTKRESWLTILPHNIVERQTANFINRAITMPDDFIA